MEIRTGPRRLPRSEATGARTMGAFVWQKIAGSLGLGQNPDERDTLAAERMDRLTRFMNGEAVAQVWTLDLDPILRECFDEVLRRVRTKEVHPDALAVFDLIQTGLQNNVNFGAEAYERIAERRLRSTVAANLEEAKQATVAR